MAKFCTNCGKELKEEAVFCEYCGSKVNDSINSTNSSNNRPMISKRDVAMAIILSIITCGIYRFYWNYKMGQKLYLSVILIIRQEQFLILPNWMNL